MSNNINLLDDFLAKWDRFAQGANELVPEIRNARAEFERVMTRLLESRDPRAASRVVFYAVIQIGGYIDVDSDLGRALKPILGDNCKVFTNADGIDTYFAGDLYCWWLDHKTEFDSYQLLDDWQQRELAQSVVIPMYRNARS